MKRTSFALACLAALAASVAAAAGGGVDRPAATATAQQGALKVVSRALLGAGGGELMGTWLNPRVGCAATRKLTVSVELDLVLPSGATVRRRPPAKTGRVANCAEGGPNFGFVVRAKRLGMACANGNWRPGRYSIGVKTRDAATGLAAHAFLYHQVTRC